MTGFLPSNNLRDIQTIGVFSDVDSIRVIVFCHTPRNMQDVYTRMKGHRPKWDRIVDNLIKLGLLRLVNPCERTGRPNWRCKQPGKVFVSDIHTFTVYFDGVKLNLLINNEVKIVHEVN